MAEEKQGGENVAEEEVTEQFKNTVTIEKAGPCKKKISIEIPQEAIKAATDEQYESLRKEAIVPGFRRGRAPRRLLEKRFGKETAEQIKLKLLAEASDSAVKDNEVNILREPDIDFENIELPESGALKFDYEVEVRPEFELPKLEGIPVNKTKLEVEDEQVDREIEQLCRYSGLWAPREDGAVEDGDQIIADAVLKIEGVEEDEKLDNTEIHVRGNGFVGPIPVEKLDELLIGAKAGDVKETSVEVPQTYFREEYRGKKVEISVDVKEIKYLKPAALDEDMFGRLGVDDEEELKERITDSLEGRLEQQSRAEMTEQIYKYMLDKTKFELPVSVVADQASMILQRQYMGLIQRGLSREQIDEQTEQLKASSDTQAQEQLKTYFIMDKVAEKLEVEVSEEEINGHIAQVAIQRGQRPERMREQMERDGSLEQFKLQVRDEKCVEKLLESAKITDVAPAKAKKKAGKKTEKSAKKSKKASRPTRIPPKKKTDT